LGEPSWTPHRLGARMKIQDKDIWHGAALTQIVEHPSFKALNRASDKYGHYLINSDIRVFLKYSKGSGPWHFTITPDDCSVMLHDSFQAGATFVTFVCGTTTIALVTTLELWQIVERTSNSQQWIRVAAPSGKSIRIRGSTGNLPRTVAHNRFPADLFD